MAFIDLTGQKYGRLYVISFSHMAANRKGSVWNVKCDCGVTKTTKGSLLRSGQAKSCGCLQREVTRNRVPDNFIDMSGLVFGMLTVIERDSKGSTMTKWICRCECGALSSIGRGNLITGRQISCGCHNRKIARERHKSHGLSQTRLYKVWAGMISRCYNKNVSHFGDYGGRGITVSDEWRTDYMNFHRDMNEGFTRGLQLDRIDVNGNYCKENCRWVTPKQNARNKRNSVYATINGETKLVVEWAEEYGIKYSSKIHDRIKRGFDERYLLHGKPKLDPTRMILK